MNKSDNSVGLVKEQSFKESNPFLLKSGLSLPEFEIIYETYGQLNQNKSNAILICHALSGHHHAAGYHTHEDQKPGWWDTCIGPNKPIDTNKFFVVSLNNLGGCHGSTGPSSVNPETDEIYGSAFPSVAVEDWVRSQALLSDHLGIRKYAAIIGGSLGGMQAIQWAIDYPERLDNAIVIAAASKLSAQNIAFNEIARHAILSDPDWHEGNYLAAGALPTRGVALARMVGHLTYMSADGMSDRFGRELREGSFSPDDNAEWVFQVESYLRHQGSRFSTQFDANTYVLMTRALDLFDLAGEYGGDLTAALSNAQANFLIASFSSDWRFPPQRSIEIRDALMAAGKSVTYANIETDNGHDGFLLPNPHYEQLLGEWMRRVGPA